MMTLDPPSIEDLEAAYQQGRAAFMSGGSKERPPQFPHPRILAAWDKGFHEAESEHRKARAGT